jgi:hypothetical protein
LGIADWTDKSNQPKSYKELLHIIQKLVSENILELVIQVELNFCDQPNIPKLNQTHHIDPSGTEFCQSSNRS